LTCSGFTPAILAITPCGQSEACVESHASTPSGFTCTVAFMGSMHACAVNGSS
jgi:hypothetical protein